MVIKSIKITDVVMDVAAFQLFVFMLFVFIPQINVGINKQLHQIAVELSFSSVDSPADFICEGDVKEN
ncbi:putative membrane protein [Vibrio vulnificus]|nr:putative membrane protein [Vibrio vulnificus]OQK61543.1 putative membrane protein [Vibrio vulnificus]